MTFGGEDYSPEVSVDGKWLFFSSWDAGTSFIMKVPVEGGEPTVVFDKGASFNPKVSPDGKLLEFSFLDQQQPMIPLILVMPYAGGEVIKNIKMPMTAQWVGFGSIELQWTPDSRSISYIDNREDYSNIWIQDLKGGEPRKLTDFKADRIFAHAWSLDGKQLAVSRGQLLSDVVLISNFR